MASKKISQLSSGSLSFLPLSGTTAVVYSGTTFQQTLSNLRQTLVDSGSHYFTGSQVINGNLTISGSITAQQYILSSSISNIVTETISGSSNFGNSLDDKHNFTGSVRITGSFDVTGSSRLQSTVIGLGLPHVDGPEVLHVENSGSYNITHFQANSNIYAQINVQNTNNGNNASSDIVITADNGSETVHYVDLGINSSTYTGGLVGYENDSYLLNVGKDMYIGTIGGTSHPSKLHLFAENNWENPQLTIHTGSQITFNTSSFTSGFTYEFSGSVKLQDELKVDGSVTASYFVGDGSHLTNLPTQPINTSSLATTGSNTFNGNQTINGSLILDNNAVIKDNFNNSISFGYQAAETNQGTQSVAIGNGAGNYNQSHGTVAIGANAGAITQGLRAVALGSLAGSNTQGEYAIAIGNYAAPNNQASHSIVISALGTALENTITNSLVIAPIRNITGSSGILQYDNTTKEVSYSNTFNGSLTASYFVGDGSQLTNLPIPTYISSGPTAPGSSVVASDNNVDINFAMMGTKFRVAPTGATINGFTVLSTATSSFVNDSAAASGGVPLYGLYRSGSFVMIRLT